MAGERWCSAERDLASVVEAEILVVALLNDGVLGAFVGLHAVHEDVEGVVHLLPRLGAGGFSDVGKAVDDPVEIGQKRPVLGEHLRRCGAEPRHAGDRLLDEPPRLLLLEVVGEMAAERGDCPDKLLEAFAAGGGFGSQHRAEGRELLEKLAVLGEEMPEDHRVGPVD